MRRVSERRFGHRGGRYTVNNVNIMLHHKQEPPVLDRLNAALEAVGGLFSFDHGQKSGYHQTLLHAL